MFVTDNSPRTQRGLSLNKGSLTKKSDQHVSPIEDAGSITRMWEGVHAPVESVIPLVLRRSVLATCGLLVILGAIISSSTSARAEVPYLLADSNSTPREVTQPVVIGSTMYSVDCDVDGSLYLLKMGPSDVSFQ